MNSFSSLLGNGPGQAGGFLGKPEDLDILVLGILCRFGSLLAFGFPVSQMI